MDSRGWGRMGPARFAASEPYKDEAAANGVVQIFTKRGERIPDGKLSVTVRNEYGQSFRPKSIPTAMAYPYLTDTLGTYVDANRSEEHTSELQSRSDLVCRLLLEKKNSQPW